MGTPGQRAQGVLPDGPVSTRQGRRSTGAAIALPAGHPLEREMIWILEILREIGEAMFLMLETVGQLRSLFTSRDKIVAQILDIGNASLPMVVILSVFIG